MSTAMMETSRRKQAKPFKLVAAIAGRRDRDRDRDRNRGSGSCSGSGRKCDYAAILDVRTRIARRNARENAQPQKQQQQQQRQCNDDDDDDNCDGDGGDAQSRSGEYDINSAAQKNNYVREVSRDCDCDIFNQSAIVAEMRVECVSQTKTKSSDEQQQNDCAKSAIREAAETEADAEMEVDAESATVAVAVAAARPKSNDSAAICNKLLDGNGNNNGCCSQNSTKRCSEEHEHEHDHDHDHDHEHDHDQEHDNDHDQRSTANSSPLDDAKRSSNQHESTGRSFHAVHSMISDSPSAATLAALSNDFRASAAAAAAAAAAGAPFLSTASLPANAALLNPLNFMLVNSLFSPASLAASMLFNNAGLASASANAGLSLGDLNSAAFLKDSDRSADLRRSPKCVLPALGRNQALAMMEDAVLNGSGTSLEERLFGVANGKVGGADLARLAMALNPSPNGAICSPPPVNGGAKSRAEAFCEYCSKLFCNKYFLKVHKQNKHAHLLKAEEDDGSSGELNDEMAAAGRNGADLCGEPNETATSIGRASGSEQSENDQAMEGKLSAAADDFEPAPTQSGKRPKPPRVKCPICLKDVCNKYFLRVHKFKVHNVPLDDMTGPPGSAPSSSKDGAFETGGLSSLPMQMQMQMQMQMHGIAPRSPASPMQVPTTMALNETVQNVLRTAKLDEDYSAAQSAILASHELSAIASALSANEHRQMDGERSAMKRSAWQVEHQLLNRSPAGSSIGETKNGISVNRANSSVLDPNNVAAFQTTTSGGRSSQRAKCDICSKLLCNKYFLRTHKLNQHGILIELNETNESFGDDAEASSPGNSYWHSEDDLPTFAKRRPTLIEQHGVPTGTSASTNDATTEAQDSSSTHAASNTNTNTNTVAITSTNVNASTMVTANAPAITATLTTTTMTTTATATTGAGTGAGAGAGVNANQDLTPRDAMAGRRCGICHKLFRNRVLLAKHIEKLHGNNTLRTPTGQPRQYFCKKCLRIFSTRHLRDVHMLSHRNNNSKIDLDSSNKLVQPFKILNCDFVDPQAVVHIPVLRNVDNNVILNVTLVPLERDCHQQ